MHYDIHTNYPNLLRFSEILEQENPFNDLNCKYAQVD
jgi:hypothetical protein